MRAPGPGSTWRFRVSDRRRIPPVLRFWVIVTNLPPPVPRKTSSTPSMLFHQKMRWTVFCFIEYNVLQL